MTIEIEQEVDNRWRVEVPSISVALAYGESRQEAVSRVATLVLRILADRLEHGETAPELAEVFQVDA
jgi:predicted RNase H-like HicB family nuclease